MVDTASRFLNHNYCSAREHSSYKIHAAARSSEEVNLQAVLLSATVAEHNTVSALLILAWHQFHMRPRTEVAEHALRLADQGPNRHLSADAMYVYGFNLYELGRFREALNQFILAREIYLQVSATRQAAWTLLEIANVSALVDSATDQITPIKQARQEFESTGFEIGAVRASSRLGRAYASIGKHPEAIFHLALARSMSPGLSVLGADCAAELALANHALEQYDEAERWALVACQEWKQLGGYTGYALRTLRKIRISKGDYDKAIECLNEGLQVSTGRGDITRAPNILLELGRAWMKKGETERARDSFIEVSRQYATIEGVFAENCLIICKFYLARLADPSLVPTAEERDALEHTYHKEDIL
ncbi:hypothetical protein C8J56DRAFT_1158343 [Mycena floridula]|nr:hypothetical protein C8J56DRAFT_1158343 [Mycena floridula]